MISVNKLQELFSNVLRIVLMCIFRDRLVSGAQVDCIVSKNMARKELIALVQIQIKCKHLMSTVSSP